MVQWGDLYQELSINKCPKCDGRVDDLHPLGFYLSVCKRCKKFWSLQIIDYGPYLKQSFKNKHTATTETRMVITDNSIPLYTDKPKSRRLPKTNR